MTATTARTEFRGLIEDVTAATAYRYGATDDRGHVMDTAKIAWIPEAGAFAAVYHFRLRCSQALDVHRRPRRTS